jgi:hypothetical protein
MLSAWARKRFDGFHLTLVRITLPTFSKAVHPENVREDNMGLIDKIKLLFAMKQPVGELVTEVQTIKAGYKTIGFWVTVFGTLVSVVASLTGFIPATLAVIISTSVTVIYNILRALQNANVEGVKPMFRSTRFWVGIGGILAAGIEALRAGGISAEWMTVATTVIAAVMAAAQSVGSNQPATVASSAGTENAPQVAPTK